MPERNVVSVIMTAHNAQEYIFEAIDSILRQTLTNFELFVIDDGSNDSTMEIINEFVLRDSRVIPIFNEKNVGQPRSRNKAIELAKGEFVAIMDADDISLPNRLETQAAYLQAHPTVGLTGSLAMEIDSKGHSRGRIRGDIRCEAEMLWAEISCVSSSVIHPTVMLRKSIVDKHQLRYNLKVPYAQDKEFWCRLLLLAEGTVLPRCLLRYRVHEKSISNSKTAKQREYAIGAVLQMVRSFLGDESISTETIEQMISIGPSFMPDALPAWELRIRILEGMEKSGRFDHDDVLSIRALEVIRFRRWGNTEAVRQAMDSGLSKRMRAGVTLWVLVKVMCKHFLRKYQLLHCSFRFCCPHR